MNNPKLEEFVWKSENNENLTLISKPVHFFTMKYVARVEVSLKPGHSDPEGETTRASLSELNYPVKSVRVSKVYEILLDAGSLAEAERCVDGMCRRLLANPVKDDYTFRLEEAG